MLWLATARDAALSAIDGENCRQEAEACRRDEVEVAEVDLSSPGHLALPRGCRQVALPTCRAAKVGVGLGVKGDGLQQVTRWARLRNQVTAQACCSLEISRAPSASLVARSCGHAGAPHAPSHLPLFSHPTNPAFRQVTRRLQLQPGQPIRRPHTATPARYYHSPAGSKPGTGPSNQGCRT